MRLPRVDQADAATAPRSQPEPARPTAGSASPISPVAATPSPAAIASQPPASEVGATPGAAAEAMASEDTAEDEDGAPPPPEEQQAAAENPPKTPQAAPAKAQQAAVPAAPSLEGGGGRVMLRAKEESWVQVRDADNAPVITRVLKPGDFVRVPDRSGLTLLTGNAGALEVLVDGEVVPPIGPRGQVRRDIALDPERLKSGTAAPRS